MDFGSAYDAIRQNREAFLENFASLPKAWQNQLTDRSHLFLSGMKYDEIMAKDWEGLGFSREVADRFKGESLFGEIKGKEDALEKWQNSGLGEMGTRKLLDMLNWNGGRKTIEELMPHLGEKNREYIGKMMDEKAHAHFNRSPIGLDLQTLDSAAALAEGFADGHLNANSDLSHVMHGWSNEQKEQFRDDYAAMEGAERHRITALLAKNGELEMRTAAVEELLANPEAQQAVGWGEHDGGKVASEVAVEMLKMDVEQAQSWVSNLPEGESRLWAMKNLAGNWINYDPEAAQEWVDSLPPAEREEIGQFMKDPGF